MKLDEALFTKTIIIILIFVIVVVFAYADCH